MVHPSVLPHSLERTRHEHFILTRLAAGATGLGLAPAYLAWRGGLGLLEVLVVVAFAVLPLAAVVLSRSGRLGLAHGLSAAGLTALTCAVAGLTGGAGSPALLGLAAIPAETVLLGGRAQVLRAAAVAALGLVAMIGLDGLDLFAATSWTVAMMPAFAALAILQVLAGSETALRRRDVEQRQHRAADRRAQLLLDHVGDLVTWHDAGGAVIFANAAARALTGAEPHDLHGRGLLDRVHVADRPLFLKALSDAANGAGQATASFRTLFVPLGENGAPVALWLEMQAHRVETEGLRHAAAVVCVMRDVTARRAVEEEQARGHAAAVKANDVKGQFLATVSHELRTPLNAIIGFSEMLSGEDNAWIDAAKRREYARIIHESGQHLLDVVNTLLDISKIESGSMTIEQEPLDLAGLVQDCATLMALRAETGGVALERVLGPGLPAVPGDRRALKQVVINLLSNAIKFTPAGGRVVLAVVRDGDMIDLSVSDTGIGIAASDLPRLGDPFFQAKGSYDRTHEGTGLGLSVVRGLVGLHGGKLTIESAPGIGTRVGVRLPVGGVAAVSQPVKIATFSRAPRRAIDTKEPLRLTA